ncbi:MAG TPA: RodZ domain-containing protein [Terriglobia bacterium]|nr:RodZ domain-containing protein [Terriglobia bacterium]
MGSFGENLRREREMRGVTLEEISDSTKISVRFLDALETEDFSKMPGGIFTRSFIRSYANYLGLDPEQVLAEYQSAFPPKNDEDFSRIGVNHAVGSSPPGHRTLIAWVTAALLLASGYALFHYSHRQTDALANFGNLPQTSKAAPITPASEASNANSPANGGATTGSLNPASDGGTGASAPNAAPNRVSASSGESSVPTSGLARRDAQAGTQAAVGGMPGAMTPASRSTQPAGNVTEPPAILGEGTMVLQVSAKERSWVAVECDGKTLLQRILNPNEVRTLRASDSINVTTGNAQGITLTLNGQTLKPLGRYGEVKTIRLTLADLKKTTSNP